MDKNYYEILQVNEKASKEVIDKVFKMLAKKYHPDLQEEGKKAQSAEKFKEINEAYQTLSDNKKREEYDKSIKQNIIKKEDFIAIYQENEQLRSIINEMKQRFQNMQQNVREPKEKEQYRDSKYQEPQNTYYSEQTNQEPEYYYKKTSRIKEFLIDKLKGIITIIIIIAIISVLFQIPVINRFFKSIYENNGIIKFIVDIVMKIFA